MRFLPVDPELIKKITLDTPIDLLPVSTRIHSCLKQEGLTTVRDIAAQSESFFWCMPNMGRKSLDQLGHLMIDAGIATHIRPPTARHNVTAYYQAKIDRNRLIYRAWQEGEHVTSLASRFRLCRTSIELIVQRGDREAAQLAKLEAGTSP